MLPDVASPPASALRSGRLRAQRPALGLLYILLGVLLILTGGIGGLYLAFVRGAPVWLALVCIVGMAYPGVRIRHRGHRHRVRVGFSPDGRVPVVFLRSFATEGNEAYPAGLNEPARARHAFWRSLIVGLRGHTRYENLLAFAFRQVGPMVAIGEPGENLPETGAQRVYFRRDDDDGWKREVEGLLGSAALVLLEAGSSPGLGWEVQRTVARLRSTPQRLVLCVPLPTWGVRRPEKREADRQATWATFRELHGHHFPRGLPARLGTAQFLSFDQDWQATPPGVEGAPVLGPAGPTPAAALTWLTALLERAS